MWRTVRKVTQAWSIDCENSAHSAQVLCLALRTHTRVCWEIRNFALGSTPIPFPGTHLLPTQPHHKVPLPAHCSLWTAAFGLLPHDRTSVAHPCAGPRDANPSGVSWPSPCATTRWHGIKHSKGRLAVALSARRVNEVRSSSPWAGRWQTHIQSKHQLRCMKGPLLRPPYSAEAGWRDRNIGAKRWQWP